MQNIIAEWMNYCVEAFELEKKDYRAHRIFKTADGEPIVFIFQKGISADYYIAVVNVENPTFEHITAQIQDKHHQGRIKKFVSILGEEICTELIECGLFYEDKHHKRVNKKAIQKFLNSPLDKDNSSFQLHRLICLFEFPQYKRFAGKEIHHIDLNPCNNKGCNLIPVTKKAHTGDENSLHRKAGIIRSNGDVIKLGQAYSEKFHELYADAFPCSGETEIKNE